MRLHLFLLLSYLALCFTTTTVSAAPSPTSAPPMSIQWYTNYEQALQQAKATGKPLVLFFTGSDWCRFCKQLEAQALNTPEFAALAGPRLIFMKIDLPQNTSSLDPSLASQNKALRKKYDIRTYPTLIIVDGTGRKINKTEYRDYGGRQYAEHLLKLVQDANNYRQQISALGQEPLSPDGYQQLYKQAKHLGLQEDSNLILRSALAEVPSSPYFMKERYRALAEEGKIHDAEAQSLRNQILSLDPDNVRHSHLDIAVIEFETYCGKMEKEHLSPEVATAPLVAYLEKFGTQDTESAWRLQMMISQVFLDNDQLNQALKYAQNSYQAAPPSVRPGIALTIQNIRAHLKTNLSPTS